MKSALSFVYSGVLFLAATIQAEALTQSELSLNDLTEQAHLIVKGKVIKSKALKLNGSVWTKHTLHVKHHLKTSTSTKKARTLTFFVEGGEYYPANKREKPLGVYVPGLPKFKVGNTVYLFLRTHQGRHLIVGHSQGVYYERGSNFFRKLADVNIVKTEKKQNHRKANNYLSETALKEQISDTLR